MSNDELLIQISEMFDEKLKPINKRFDQMDARLDVMETKLGQMEIRLDQMDARLDQVETRLDCMDVKIGQIEARIDQLDAKIDNVREEAHSEIKYIRLLLENDVLPRLQNIESCYTDTYERYAVSTEKIDAMQRDIDILKNVVSEHSRKLQNIQ